MSGLFARNGDLGCSTEGSYLNFPLGALQQLSRWLVMYHYNFVIDIG